MSDKKTISEMEIASKLKAGKPFSVLTNRERKKVLAGAKFLGIRIITRLNGDASAFNVNFVK